LIARFVRHGAALALLLPLMASALTPCRLKGVEHEARCGQLVRPLDPAQPQGTQIDVHFAVLPALARNKHADPVVFFAGGPGQSAIELAGPLSRLLARFAYRRDIVLIDQRGTGRSAALMCDEVAPNTPLRDSADPARQVQRLRECRERLLSLPHGDLRHYATSTAMADADAVRRALGVVRWNLIGASYGTRAALEYLRLHPNAVRRLVLDGVAPPDMRLPQVSAVDAQAVFDALLRWCEADGDCRSKHSHLRQSWRALLDSLPREVRVTHPLSGRAETLTLTRDMLFGLLRVPLYSPVLSSALPVAIDEAAGGRFDALVGLAASVGAGRLAEGMHFSVICSEDAVEADAPAAADFGAGLAPLYRQVCADWPRAAVNEAFYKLTPARVPALLLSGELDPVTPPRHAERVARALGGSARQVVVPNAGHGVLGLGCMAQVVFRFIDADSDAEALQVDAGCTRALPRPALFVPPGGGR
jgi:pimeloyl-ACP methyl ester carboxylesterase